MRPIRVLHIIDSWNLGGAQTVLLSLLRHGDAQCFEQAAYSLHGPGALEAEARQILARSGHFGSSKFDPLLVWKLVRTVRTWRPDIVHTHLISSCFLAEMLLPFLARDVRLVTHMHSTYRPPDHEQKYQNLLERMIYRRSDRVVACSFPALESLERARGGRLPNARVVFNGVSDDLMTGRVEEDRARHRSELEAGRDAVVVLTACRLSPTKNLRYGVEMMARLRRECPSLEWWIAGTGPEEDVLRRAVLEAGLTSVRFLGYRADVPALLSAADFFLLPSLYEGLSLAIAEALAKGAVPVVTPFDGYDQMIEHGRNGVVIPFGEAEQAAAAWLPFLRNDALRGTLAEAGLKVAIERFSASKMASDVGEVYRELCPGEGTGL